MYLTNDKVKLKKHLMPEPLQVYLPSVIVNRKGY